MKKRISSAPSGIPMLILSMALILICLTSNSQDGKNYEYNRNILFLENWKYHGSNDPMDASPVNYRDKSWETVDLPHSWVTATQNRNLKFSNAWYRSSFEIDKIEKGQQVFLFFERVSINSSVYVNGKIVGTHKGAMNAFIFNITDYLSNRNTNTVAVKVSNEMDLQAMPSNYAGGILGQVKVIVTPEVHIDQTFYASSGIFITPTEVSPEKVEFSIHTHVQNAGTTDKTIKVNQFVVRAANDLGRAARRACRIRSLPR